MPTPAPADFPAAHSMDSCWFAVDETGAVAAFDTGEGGSIPVSGFPMNGQALEWGEDHLAEASFAAAVLMAAASSDAELAALLPSERTGEVLEAG